MSQQSLMGYCAETATEESQTKRQSRTGGRHSAQAQHLMSTPVGFHEPKEAGAFTPSTIIRPMRNPTHVTDWATSVTKDARMPPVKE